jgi:hypothetical protein
LLKQKGKWFFEEEMRIKKKGQKEEEKERGRH